MKKYSINTISFYYDIADRSDPEKNIQIYFTLNNGLRLKTMDFGTQFRERFGTIPKELIIKDVSDIDLHLDDQQFLESQHYDLIY